MVIVEVPVLVTVIVRDDVGLDVTEEVELVLGLVVRDVVRLVVGVVVMDKVFEVVTVVDIEVVSEVVVSVVVLLLVPVVVGVLTMQVFPRPRRARIEVQSSFPGKSESQRMLPPIAPHSVGEKHSPSNKPYPSPQSEHGPAPVHSKLQCMQWALVGSKQR